MNEKTLESAILTPVVSQFSSSVAGNLGKFYVILIFKDTLSCFLSPQTLLAIQGSKQSHFPMAYSLVE